jgi:hypothetical protein
MRRAMSEDTLIPNEKLGLKNRQKRGAYVCMGAFEHDSGNPGLHLGLAQV